MFAWLIIEVLMRFLVWQRQASDPVWKILCKLEHKLTEKERKKKIKTFSAQNLGTFTPMCEKCCSFNGYLSVKLPGKKENSCLMFMMRKKGVWERC